MTSQSPLLLSNHYYSVLPSDYPENWLLMLDVDGTLVDFVHHHNSVTIPLPLKETLLRLYFLLSGALFLVSGRSIHSLDRLFFPLKLPAIGSHGGEQRLGNKVVLYSLPGIDKTIKELAETCRKFTRSMKNVYIERKSRSVAIHCRLNPSACDEILQRSRLLVKSMGKDWTLLEGKFGCEIKPSGFNKQSAVRSLCQMKKFAHRKPVFAGDDVTDEPALIAVRDMGGYAIKVGSTAEEGMFRVDNPALLTQWLAHIAGQHKKLPDQPLSRPRIIRNNKKRKERVIIISNRVSMKRGMPNSGGLAIAMSSILKNYKGVWAGWSGKVAPTPSLRLIKEKNITYLACDMSPQQHKDFYISFCNGALWPLLHNNVELMKFSREAYSAYQEMNCNYAGMMKQHIAADDYLWVHDFHFIPLAMHLRQLGVKNRIGFFLHTPFPPHEVMAALPVHKELISAFYAYDLVGFQTQRDLHLFQDYNIQENLHSEKKIRKEETLFAHFPIGVDTQDLAKASCRNILAKEAQDLKASISGRKLIIGVDRLDYSKGILQRLQAIDAMLDSDGSLRRQFTFLQISPPTREDVEQYQKLRMEVETLVGHINGMYTEVDWVPIRFLARGVKRDLLSAFYRLSSVCLVTPLRDGMNLVAKEFVASQDENDPGVLILSRFAGAAEELSQAILVNPYDINEITDAIKLGLRMPLAERQKRWRAMYDIISRQTLKKWYNDYMDSLMTP